MTVTSRLVRIGKRHFSTRLTPINISSSSAWNDSLKCNSLLKQLYHLNKNGKILIKPYSEKCTETNINLSTSLPITQIPTARITSTVKSDGSIGNWRKPLVKWFRVGKFLLGMYKIGIKSTWSTYFESKNFKYTSYDLTKLIEFKEIESRVLKQNKFDEIDITRRQYLQWLRREEFWKIPKFLVTFLMFEEATPLVCYLFPSLSPWSCLTPGLYQKITDSRCAKLIKDSDTNKAYISPYHLDKSSVSRFLTTHNILSTWKMKIYDFSGEFRIPLLKIVETNQKIHIDDWLLLREFLRGEDVTVIISDRELVDAVCKRQLYEKGENLNRMVEDKDGQEILKLRLLFYLSFKFDGTISAHDLNGKLVTEKWGVDNMAVFNFCGSNELLKTDNLKHIGL